MKLLLRSFRVKITLILILSLLFVGAMSNFLIYRFFLNSQFNELRSKLMIIAQTAALLVDADVLLKVPATPEGVYSSQYQIIADKLRKIKEVNRPIKYIYTMTKTEKEGIWQFVVDPDPLTASERGKGLNSYPGATYDASRFPEMLKGFHVPSADTKLEVDEWGVTLSGYAPIKDDEGRPVAMLGVDIAADNIYAIQKEVGQRALLVLLLGIVFSLSLGILISGRIIHPIKKLLQATRHIAEGNLQYQVDIKGEDEIGELARSFNQMARSLYESRKRILNYFYDVVQSFVRILEVRDRYTKGHAEAVAKYAEKIALKMGFSEDRVGLLKEVALLHDIGKLGIKESILNKKEMLTEQEWEMIKKHPAIGGEILEPVLLSDEMLAVVRQHHERYDGNGYPDKLNGDKINVFAAILAVADAYDAMVSDRAYRDALSKEEAIGELKKNSGTQFRPEVVHAFLEILQEEDK